jgi:co-chaperonin GroES (HSP10)
MGLNMRVLGSNVLVSEAKKEETTAGGIILQGDVATGNKPAIVIAVGNAVSIAEQGILPKQKVYLDWTKAFPVELDGVKCAVVDVEDIKLVMGDEG